MEIQRVTDRNFGLSTVLSDQPVLVGFRAAYCRESDSLEEVLSEVAGEFSGSVQLKMIDAEKLADRVVEELGLHRLPMTLLIHNGRQVDFIGGIPSKRSLREMVAVRLAPVLVVDDFDFESEVIQSEIPVVVHFGAAWCKESQSLSAILEDLAREFSGRAKLVYVEHGSESINSRLQYGVKRVPSLGFFVGGKSIDWIYGSIGRGQSKKETLTSTENIRSVLETVV